MDEATLGRRLELLRGTPLFSALGVEEIRGVAAAFVERSYRKGAVVCREGQEGNSFYVIESGELEVRGGGENGRLLARMRAGEVLGEMSLLFESPRTATVTVSRPARLLELDRRAFQEFFSANPKVLHYFATLLSQRLAANAREEVPERAVTVVAVSGPRGLRGKSLVAHCLAGLLRREADAEVLLVKLERLGRSRAAPRRQLSLADLERAGPDRIKSQLHVGEGREAVLPLSVGRADAEREVRALEGLISRLGDAFPWIVLDLGSGKTARESAREIGDVSVELVDRCEPGDPEPVRGPTRVHRVLNLANESCLPIPINHCEPFVIPEDSALAGAGGERAAEYLLAHPRSPASPPLRRLVNKLLGTSLGLAVGGGAAFGIAHVGVVQVLEEAGVPIDLVAGTSMGSIVALGYAAGLTPADMIEISAKIGTKLTTFSALDFTLLQPGVLAGRRLVQIFSPLLPVKRFDQLRFPCRAVAADIESGEPVPIGEGSLEAAFRASCSVPMLWVPVRRGDQVLVDGGMVDPVPEDVVRAMGADLCIAVNVVPPLRKDVTNVVSRMWRRLNALNPLSYVGGRRGMPNLLDVFMNTIQMLQHELGNFKAISADVRITPDLSEFTWIEFYRPQELIERGAEAAERALPEIRRMLAERRAAPQGRRPHGQPQAGADSS